MKSINIVKQFLSSKLSIHIKHYTHFFSYILSICQQDTYLSTSTQLSKSQEGWDILYIQPLDTYIQYEKDGEDLIGVYTIHPSINNMDGIIEIPINDKTEDDIIQYLKDELSIDAPDSLLDLLHYIYDSTHYQYKNMVDTSNTPFPIQLVEDQQIGTNTFLTFYFQPINTFLTVTDIYEDSWTSPDWTYANYYFSTPSTSITTTYHLLPKSSL